LAKATLRQVLLLGEQGKY